jgi:hypothetical protein
LKPFKNRLNWLNLLTGERIHWMDLTKPPEKILVGSVVGVVALLWLLVWLFGPRPEPVQTPAQLPVSLAGLQSKQIQPEEEIAAEQIPDTWGRDPFALPFVEEVSKPPLAKKGPPKERRKDDKPDYEVSTVLISGLSRLVVINERVYAVGDQINGETVTKITLNQVVLTGDLGERVLLVPGPETSVTVENPGKQ